MGERVSPRRLQTSSRSLTSRTVRVLPDVSGIESSFDYSVPENMSVELGSIVRIDLHGRRVRGWVIELDSEPPAGVRLLPITKVSSLGPDASLIDLASWAAHRWTGRRSFYLGTASPERNVAGLPRAADFESQVRPKWFDTPDAVFPLPPASDPFDLVDEAHRAGPALVVTPSRRGAQRLVRLLRQAGHRNVVLHPDGWDRARAGGNTVVGTRAAAWCPMPNLTSAVIVDAYDEGHRSEASPTWSAVDVVAERARRADVPLLLLSSVPRLELTERRTLLDVDRNRQREGWAPLHVIDTRKSDPKSGLYTPAVVEMLRSDKRVVCVLNRKGRAQLLVCSACDEVAVCERCASSLRMTDAGVMTCRRCSQEQPTVCRHCASSKFKQLRAGVARVREELESLANRPVGEVTAETKALPETMVLVGTEAVLHRVGRADAVVFLEFDQELLATRYRAAEDALVLLARASRLVGGRKNSGSVFVQTRMPENEVIDAALHADPLRLLEVERRRRKELGWPPYSALARVSGPGADELAMALPDTIVAFGPDDDGQWMVQAPDEAVLEDAFAVTKRPKARVRIEIDPVRI